MPRYAITNKAGKFVAGQNNRGVGTVLTLTEKQAAHELRLGSLVPVDGSPGLDPEAALGEMTVKDLRALAEERGVTVDPGAKKDEIIAALEAK